MRLSKGFLLLSIVGSAAYLGGCAKESPNGPMPPPTSGKPAQFSESRPPAIVKLSNSVIAGGKCNMESINGVAWSTQPPYEAKRTENVSIVGWGVDNEAKRLPDSIFLRFQLGDREFYAPIETIRVSRPDLVAYSKDDLLGNSGYRADASLANLPPGEFQAMIVMTFPDKAILCAAGRTVRIQ